MEQISLIIEMYIFQIFLTKTAFGVQNRLLLTDKTRMKRRERAIMGKYGTSKDKYRKLKNKIKIIFAILHKNSFGVIKQLTKIYVSVIL